MKIDDYLWFAATYMLQLDVVYDWVLYIILYIYILYIIYIYWPYYMFYFWVNI